MSSNSKSDSDISVDVEELLQIGTRCRELRKEKDLLKESQSHGFELIRSLEAHVRSLSESRAEDKKHIQKLESELLNCSQEIDYLQDQLNLRNTEVNYLGEHVRSLELKFADTETLNETVSRLRGELKSSETECFLMMQKLENKELELQESILRVEKLEESISSSALESQCEIESMKIDIMALEQSCREAKKKQEETVQEKARLTGLIQELEVQFQDAQETIKCLDKENKELREKSDLSEINDGPFCQKVQEWLEKKGRSQVRTESILSEVESNFTISRELSYGEVFDPQLSKLAIALEPDIDLKVVMENMRHQICQYELLVKKLKEELREEKLKAKEEAEDLAQEMAELRYQMTGLLEEERKRRACIEQASLQRITKLEAQLRFINNKEYPSQLSTSRKYKSIN